VGHQHRSNQDRDHGDGGRQGSDRKVRRGQGLVRKQDAEKVQQIEAVGDLSVEPDNAEIEGPKQRDRSPRYQGNQAGGANAFEHQHGRGLLSRAEIAENNYRQERRDGGDRGPYAGNPASPQ